MRILSVVGTRPQLIKVAALQPELRRRHHEIFVDTGQHFDHELAGSFFSELGLPAPDHSLGIGGGGHAEQTGLMLMRLEPLMVAERPDAVLVYGDTNSTLAGALAAAKLGIPVAHVEAGLRAFDRTLPEELNRVVVDHLAHWLFAPTDEAVANLAAEGIHARVTLVGDLMQDLAARVVPQVCDPGVLVAIGERLSAELSGAHGPVPLTLATGGFLFATIHRADNRRPEALRTWAQMLATVARPDRPVILALHPGTRAALDANGVSLAADVVAVPPQPYRATLALQLHAAAVLTDSGGVQRESAWLGTPCLILRSTTEWSALVEGDAPRTTLVGLDVGLAVAALERLAPVAGGRRAAVERASTVSIEPAHAGEAISAALEAR